MLTKHPLNHKSSSDGCHQNARITVTSRSSIFQSNTIFCRCPFIYEYEIQTHCAFSWKAVRKRLHISGAKSNIIMCPHHRHIDIEVAIFFDDMNVFIHCQLLALLHIAHYNNHCKGKTLKLCLTSVLHCLYYNLTEKCLLDTVGLPSSVWVAPKR